MRTTEKLIRVMAGGIGLVLLSCNRDPMESRISAATPLRFSAWRSSIASDASPLIVAQVEEALREIRIEIVRKAKLEKTDGSLGSVENSVCLAVHGKRVREVVQLGYELLANRLRRETEALEEAVSLNQRHLVTRPGDTESQQYLDDLQVRQKVRLENYRRELNRAQTIASELMQVTGRTLVAAEPTDPDEMPVRLKR